jgi:PAS domain S-box-containing protein
MRTPPLRLVIPVALALTSVLLTSVGVAFDRYNTYRTLESSSLRRAASLVHIAAPAIEDALLDDDRASAADAVERLALEPSVRLSFVVDDAGRILQATDPALRGRTLAASGVDSSADIIIRVRRSHGALVELSPDGNTVRAAAPMREAPQPGEVRGSRFAVLYTESDLRGPKAEAFAEILRRSGLLFLVALLACVVVWVYLRRTFTAQLDRFVASVSAFAQGRGELEVPSGGSHELAEIGATMARLIADLKAEHARSREVEARFSRVFENAPVPIYLCDADTWRVYEVNEEFVRVSGYSRDTLIGRSVVETGWLSDAERARIVAILAREGCVRGIDIRATTRTGETLDCLFTADIVQIDGRPLVLAISQNITEARRAERALLANERRFR